MGNIIFYLTLMIPITWSPGPNNIMCVSVGSRYGTTKTIPFILGLNIPNLFYAVATGFGMGIITEKYPQTIEALKFAGGIYVFYLGWKILNSHVKAKNKTSDIGFKDGFIISSLNAKSITVILLMYSQFPPANTTIFIQTLILSISFVALCIVGHFGWATIGQISSKLLLSSKALKIQNYIFSSLLFLTGIWIFFS
jgi:threonine/homoserine/homoserine lactone efflux protein